MMLMWWYWLVVGIALLVADIVVIGTFYLLWLGLSCMLVATMLLAAPDLPLIAQVIAWGIFNVILLGGWITFGKKMLKNKALQRPEKLIGVNGVITEWHNGSGKIRFQRPYGGNDVWQASSESGELAVGTNVKVTSVQAADQSVTVTTNL